MKNSRIIATVLALLMFVSTFATVFTLPAFADGEETTEAPAETATEAPAEDTEGETADGETADGETTEEGTEETANKSALSIDYTTTIYNTPQDKLDSMELVYSYGDYDLYYQMETGEVAIKNNVTSQILFTNPYDSALPANKATEREKLLSQIIVNYMDNGEEKQMNSYAQAAQLSQVKMSKIRGGIRVEYIIGKASSKRTVPVMIRKETFEEKILTPLKEKISESQYKQFLSYYQLKNAEDPSLTESQRQTLYNTLPITRKMAVYVLEETTLDVEREMSIFEKLITENTSFTYDDVVAAHEEAEYTGTTKAPAVFRMALEYYVTDEGLEVRLPARGIRYDATQYSLNNIQILPYFGAFDKEQKGYVLLPDGSGTLVRFEDASPETATTITSGLYGEDYTFYTQKTVANMQQWTLPVYGMRENTSIMEDVFDTIKDVDEEGNEVETVAKVGEKEVFEPKGFVAIVTEGDSLVDIATASGGLLNKYFTTSIIAYPRPKDTYPLDGISVAGGTATWTVEANKKYTGNYRIKYFMLFGEDSDYVGMAKTYRNYLEKTGVLKEKEATKDDIELYIETFGTIKTTERKAGVPVDVMKPLTSFDDAKLIIDTLANDGITKLSLRYRGFANGGLDTTAPTKLKIEKVLGGKNGLKELVAYAKEKGVNLYPDFDFVYVSSFSGSDGFNAKRDSSKTVDNRSAIHRSYDPIYQAFIDDRSLLISPNRLLTFWKKLNKSYSTFGFENISLGTIGSDLCSDYNEDDSLNRDDSEIRVKEFMNKVREDGYGIMVDTGNSYTLQYADTILNAPLDSSNRYVASETVPFLGMVLHGYKNFTGSAINLAGDYSYEVLKTIENGANPYFILSYENTEILKSSEEYSKYYSIRFDIWYDDVVRTYKTLNKLLKPVSNAKIDSHEIVTDRISRVAYDNGTVFELDYENYTVKVDDEYVINLKTNEVLEDGNTVDIDQFLKD